LGFRLVEALATLCRSFRDSKLYRKGRDLGIERDSESGKIELDLVVFRRMKRSERREGGTMDGSRMGSL
jgi:hypothetical protein